MKRSFLIILLVCFFLTGCGKKYYVERDSERDYGNEVNVICHKLYEVENSELYLTIFDNKEDGKTRFNVSIELHNSDHKNKNIDNSEIIDTLYFLYKKYEAEIDFEEIDRYAFIVNIVCDDCSEKNEGKVVQETFCVDNNGYVSWYTTDGEIKEEFPLWMKKDFSPRKFGGKYKGLNGALQEFVSCESARLYINKSVT